MCRSTDVISMIGGELGRVVEQKVCVVTNAGDVNPEATARALRFMADDPGVLIRVAGIREDDLMGWGAIAADMGASLLVVFNGLRLLRGQTRRGSAFGLRDSTFTCSVAAAVVSRTATEALMTRSWLRTLGLITIAGVLVASGACSDGTQNAGTLEVALVRVSPRGGSMSVDPNTQVALEFDSRMANGMEAFCAVHIGELDGPEVGGRWDWSQDRHRLTFTPDQPLGTSVRHTVHVGGGLTDANGHRMNFEPHGFDMGGQWVDETTFGPGGMMGGHPHMGEGWEHHNGTYGMAFPFSTAP
jgi:hypothetical protein